ncbi:unnamed protein product [marine sediment metagenome]|uniref:Uncharacterized protein n=1 Tax=marine sediment metagenome TaxID=412755 RepID=X0TC07_9ZZZZ
MKRKLILLIGLSVMVTTLVLLKRGSAYNYEFVKVGGESNQCECTKRIEQTDNWLERIFK